MAEESPVLRFFHFNDVYDVESRTEEPVGGAARMVTLVKQLKQDASSPVAVVFSGDCLSPSSIGAISQGSHMIDVMNNMQVDCACLGNHDFDNGMELLQSYLPQFNFPWYLGNIICSDTKEPIVGQGSRMIKEYNGLKVGYIFVVEKEWLATLTSLPPTATYLPQEEIAARDVKWLKEQGCEMIVAVTHSRKHNDLFLVNNVPEIDILLGGHDHDYYILHGDDGTIVLNSGCNFREATLIKSFKSKGGTNKWRFELEKQEIKSTIEEDVDTAVHIAKWSSQLSAEMCRVLAFSTTPLNVKFNVVRASESNFADFVCDTIRKKYKTDAVLIPGGCFRSDDIYGPGDFTLGNLSSIFPYNDGLIVFSIKGEFLWKALENGFSKCPALEGRYAQVAGLRVDYDPSRPPLSRVLEVSINHNSPLSARDLLSFSHASFSDSNWVPMEDDCVYTVVTTAYVFNGGDDYGMLKENAIEVLIDEENSRPLSQDLLLEFRERLIKGKLLQKLKGITAHSTARDFFKKLNSSNTAKHEEQSHPSVISPTLDKRILDVSKEQRELQM